MVSTPLSTSKGRIRPIRDTPKGGVISKTFSLVVVLKAVSKSVARNGLAPKVQAPKKLLHHHVIKIKRRRFASGGVYPKER